MIPGYKDFPFGLKRPEPGYEIIVLSTHQVILYSIPSTDNNICNLRHLKATMVAVGVGECEDGLFTDFDEHRYMISSKR